MPRFEPDPQIGWEALRAEFVHEIRWWSLDAIDEAVTSSKVLFAPRRLATLARDLLRRGPPLAADRHRRVIRDARCQGE